MKRVQVVYQNLDGPINSVFEKELAELLARFGLEEVGSGFYFEAGERDMDFQQMEKIELDPTKHDGFQVYTDSGDPPYVYFSKLDSFNFWCEATGYGNAAGFFEVTRIEWEEVKENPFLIVNDRVFILYAADLKDEPIRDIQPIDWNEYNTES